MENIYIKVDERFGADKTIKRFKRMCDTYGIVREYRTRQEYRKPSIKAKLKTEEAEKRRNKLASKSRRFRSKI
jgi:small subunit ribosomal protein S21